MKRETGVRSRITIRGAVQGVGFRPFVYRLASELELRGFVRNNAQGVVVEVEGPTSQIDNFLNRLSTEIPPRSFIQSLESMRLDPLGYSSFRIQTSRGGDPTALVLPDIATCSECLREVFDPADRRYYYPFTNCTNCGPRFSIIEALPYDRSNTTMKAFRMCKPCREEYENPLDRRFHAQPNACPECGPRLEWWDRKGNKLVDGQKALLECVAAIRDGRIVAVKGLGGFHLMVAAHSDPAVGKLRSKKAREQKPLALMFPNVETVQRYCRISQTEHRLLHSPESPIVLLERLADGEAGTPPAAISSKVAPGNPYYGVLLPYTPLHHLLLTELGLPVVATSGNLSDEPICTSRSGALQRLSRIADFLLVHNRPIARHVDDSIVRVMAGRELMLRRARGYAPLPLTLKKTPPPLLAVGGQLKNAVAMTAGPNIFISQHIGELETAEAHRAFQGIITSFQRLYQAEPERIATDLHPDYHSTQFANRLGKPLIQVQHHFAHILSCMAENELEGTVLGVSWDGTGYGTDGTIWGGEFLRVAEDQFTRLGCLRTFPLPGGEKAIRQTCRTAIGLLYEILGEELWRLTDLPPLQPFRSRELHILSSMLNRKVNSPRCSSAGRIFDAVASILGIRQEVGFEGQAAMDLEFAVGAFGDSDCYPFEIVPSIGPQIPFVVDWAPMLAAMLRERQRGTTVAEMAGRFHNTLCEMIVEAARHSGEQAVVLSGGCFQNKYLTEHTIERLQAAGFRPYWHQRIPPNDGGICVGQVIAAAAQIGRD